MGDDLRPDSVRDLGRQTMRAVSVCHSGNCCGIVGLHWLISLLHSMSTLESEPRLWKCAPACWASRHHSHFFAPQSRPRLLNNSSLILIRQQCFPARSRTDRPRISGYPCSLLCMPAECLLLTVTHLRLSCRSIRSDP
jgi:hypothetical protein